MTFRPTCPRCGTLCEPEATICDCGSRTGVGPSPHHNGANRGAVPPVVGKHGTGRYVVTEIEGDLTPRPGAGPHKPAGMSAHVLDTAVCHRMVATFRTEDLQRNSTLTPWQRREHVRVRARALADALNADDAA